MSHSIYKKILDVAPNTQTMKTDIKAYSILNNLGRANRELFSDYCDTHNRKNAQTALTAYADEMEFSPMARRFAKQIKQILLKNTHHNYHKVAMTSAIGQAYIDLCFAISLAEYCHIDNGEDLPASEYISLAKDSVAKLISELPQVQQSIKSLNLEWCKGKLIDEFNVILKGDFNSDFTIKRIDTAMKILTLFNENRIKYDSLYEDIYESLNEQLELAEAAKVLPYLLTVKRNKIEFIAEEVEQADQMVRAFSNDAIEYFKNNMPTDLPGIEETRTFLVRNKQQESSLDELL